MFLMIVCLLTCLAQAQNDIYLIVFDFESKGNIEEDYLRQLEEKTRDAARDVFPSKTSKVTVMGPEDLMRRVKQQGKSASCLNNDCVMSIAKEIDAQLVVRGSVTFNNGVYQAKINVFDSKSGAGLWLGGTEATAKDFLDLRASVYDKSYTLMERHFGVFDLGRTGSLEFEDPNYPFEVKDTTYRIISLTNDLLDGAQVDIEAAKNRCDTANRTHCSVLVDSHINDVVQIQISKPGYRLIRKTVNVSSEKEIAVPIQFTPMYGFLTVSSSDPFGNPCIGTVTIDGEKKGQTPWSDRVLAKPHTVFVDCEGMANTREVNVEERQTANISLRVKPYSDKYLERQQRTLFRRRVIDWGLLVATGTTASLASSNFSNGQQAFTDAAGIQNASESQTYQDLLATGRDHIQMTNVHLSLCGTSAGVGILHYLLFTKKTRKHVQEVRDIRMASGEN